MPPSARNLEAEASLQQNLGLPSLLAAVLVKRGYDTPESAHKFLNPSLEDLASPKRLPDYDAAAGAILGAKERKETIFVHGDYDVDGVSSAALFTRFLRKIGCDVIVHVPHRMKHGYGVHEDAVEAARLAGAKLFLTCDCGISAHEQVKGAREAGMVVVVTDHHSIGETLPNATAVVNPHRVDSDYPFAELAGVGVVFRLCEGVSNELGYPVERYRRAFLDLTALGTVADVMPLVGENRAMTKFGLPQIQDTKKAGLRALLTESDVLAKAKGHLKSWHIGWVLGPRLNAAGRMDDAALSLDLLLTDDPIEAGILARKIEEINRERKEEQEQLIAEAVDLVEKRRLHEKSAIVVYGESWHPGIIGLVAGRLVERYKRPAIVITVDPKTGLGKASARSIPGFNLAMLLAAHKELVTGGGHAMAAGFSVDANRVDEVATRFDEYASARLGPDDFRVLPAADAIVGASELTIEAVRSLDELEPFGANNPEPVFVAHEIQFLESVPTKTQEHAQVYLQAGNQRRRAIAFHQAESFSLVPRGSLGDLYFSAKVEDYNGNDYVKWQIKQFVPSSEPVPRLAV